MLPWVCVKEGVGIKSCLSLNDAIGLSPKLKTYKKRALKPTIEDFETSREILKKWLENCTINVSLQRVSLSTKV